MSIKSPYRYGNAGRQSELMCREFRKLSCLRFYGIGLFVKPVAKLAKFRMQLSEEVFGRQPPPLLIKHSFMAGGTSASFDNIRPGRVR